MVTGIDPVANGIIESLARPGGNITGVATLAQDLNGKRLELLTDVVPKLSRVAVLWAPADSSGKINFQEYQDAARALRIQLQSLEVQREAPDILGAFQRHEGACRCTHHDHNCCAFSATETNSQSRYREPAAYYVSRKHVGRCRRSHVLLN
jgi:NH3-dependent NAD+ synthetase